MLQAQRHSGGGVRRDRSGRPPDLADARQAVSPGRRRRSPRGTTRAANCQRCCARWICRPSICCVIAQRRSSPMATVSALLPDLPMANVRRVMDALEASIGNGFHNIPPSLDWPMIAGDASGRDHDRLAHAAPRVAAGGVPGPLVEELEGSKRVIEEHLGAPVAALRVSRRPVHAARRRRARAGGLRFGYTACPHRDVRHPALTIERLLLWEGSSVDGDGQFSPAILRCQVHDLWPPARTCDRVHYV